MSNSGQKICLVNPDGSVGQLHTDNQGNLIVAGTTGGGGVPAAKDFDVSVTITPGVISSDTTFRDEIILLADINNTDTIKLGQSGSVTFPLVPGASKTYTKSELALIWAVADSGTQILHVSCGGS